jgi:hypothetical protein
MIMFMNLSNIASLKIIDSYQNFDFGNKFVFYKVHIMINKTNCTQGGFVYSEYERGSET